MMGENWEIATPEGHDFKIYVDDSPYNFGKGYRGGGVAMDVQKAITRWLPLSGTFVDVGANLGFFTFMASRRVGPGGRVVAFEPGADNYRMLEESVRINDASNVRTYRMAIGSSHGTADLYMNLSSGGHSLLPRSGNLGTEQVAVSPLDTAMGSLDGEIDLIKIDVEGAEMGVIAGAVETLKRTRIVHIDIHFQDGIKTETVSAAMRANGFETLHAEQMHGIYQRVTA